MLYLILFTYTLNIFFIILIITKVEHYFTKNTAKLA